MNSILAILFSVAFVVIVHGASFQRSDLINQHALELTEVFIKIWNSRPDIFNRIEPRLQCQMLDQCCEDQTRSEAITYFTDTAHSGSNGPFNKLMRKCIYSNANKPTFQQCVDMQRAARESWKLENDPDVVKYSDILIGHLFKLRTLDFIHLIEFNCSGKEVHGVFCDLNTKLGTSCAEKILQQIYDHDQTNYKKNVQFIQQLLNDAYENIVETFTTKA